MNIPLAEAYRGNSPGLIIFPLGTLSNNTVIEIELSPETPTQVNFVVVGTAYSIAEIGEILAWIRTSLSGGVPEHGSVQACTPSLLGSSASMKIEISMNRDVPTIQDETQAGNCWSNILGTVVSVRGYPTARRPEHNTGMEMPLPMMISLANARRLTRFKDMFCIKGFCSIIVPTRQENDFIYWHLIANLDGEHISYTDTRVYALTESYPKELSDEDLASSRYILGWSPQV